MSVTAPRGFRASGVACGIQPGRPDLALIVADAECSAAAVFTTNLAQAAPVLVSREHVSSGRGRAVVVNAGCANAGTGEAGLADARAMARLTAEAVGCSPQDVVVASTGVIGVRLPMHKVRSGIREAAASLDAGGGPLAARAILTTDTHSKETVVEIQTPEGAQIGAMAKGAGMIAPRMATLLAFFTTDAQVAPELLREALLEAVGYSLNRITVDGDTSTNDMAVILASGASGLSIQQRGPELEAFKIALTEASRQMAERILRDGEGATRIAEVRVEGARTAAEADRVARTVAESPLVKTALHGGDPNWGRILAAVGRSGVSLDISRVDLLIGDLLVCAGGAAAEYDEDLAHAAMTSDPTRIRVRLSSGTASGFVWTCDFSRGYVDINSHYRS